jgi:tetratricopeptide (TPR) repeat protein
MIDFDQLWNFSQPKETEEKFRNLIPDLKAAGNPDRLLELYTQIARTQGLQRQFAEAHATLDSVQAQLNDETEIAEVRLALERGRVFNSSGEKEKARPLFLRAFELATQCEHDALAVDAAHMVAIAEKDPSLQHDWNLKALAIAEASRDPKAQKWLGSLYNNIGWTFHAQGRFNEALDMFQKALVFREKQRDPGGTRVATWCVARTHRSLGNIDQAWQMQKSLEKEFETLLEKDGYVFEELGELALLKGDREAARAHFARAFEILSQDKWFAATESARLERMKKES